MDWTVFIIIEFAVAEGIHMKFGSLLVGDFVGISFSGMDWIRPK